MVRSDGEPVERITRPLRLKPSQRERQEHYQRKAEREERRLRRRLRRQAREQEGREALYTPSRSHLSRQGNVDDALRVGGHCEQEQLSWSAKLGELLQDDVQGGFGEYGGRNHAASEDASAHNDAMWEEEMAQMSSASKSYNARQYESDVPKRWRDAAQGFETNIARGTAGLRELDDEEYAEYIRDGMHRRRHARQITFEEDRRRQWEQQERKKEKEREEKSADRRRRKQQRLQADLANRLDEAREKWDQEWREVDVPRSTGQVRVWSVQSLPLPVIRRPSSPMLVSKSDVSAFLFDAEATSEDAQMAGSQRLRAALRRYHPDRFFSSSTFSTMAHEAEREAVRALVLHISQILTEIVGERRG